MLAAGGDDDAAKKEALTSLCAAYWGPIYAYIERRGYRSDHAKDLTQEFMSRLLERDWLAGLTREGSKFRAFLLVAVKRFLAVEHERQSAQKRGGGTAPLSLHSGDLAEPPSQGETPDILTIATQFCRVCEAIKTSILGRLRRFNPCRQGILLSLLPITSIRISE